MVTRFFVIRRTLSKPAKFSFLATDEQPMFDLTTWWSDSIAHAKRFDTREAALRYAEGERTFLTHSGDPIHIVEVNYNPVATL